MKTKSFLLLSFAFYLLSFPMFPQGFNYQAVARNAAGTVLANQNVGFRFSILQGSSAGTIVYSETHDLNTDGQGVVSLVIGNGSVISGSFTALDWSKGPYYLKVEMDPTGGTSYTLTETKRIQPVAYALYSEISDSLTPGKLEIKGDASQNDEEALFEVKRNDGQTVFAVYPDGVRIYVMDEIGKGTKSGFAVGGFNPAKGLTGEFLRVTPDSVRIYVADDPTKSKKGGFAVGGYNPVKGITNEYLRVTSDSVRVYIDNSTTKASKGGFAVGGFNPIKEPAVKFVDLTPRNYFIGHLSGSKNSTGLYNSFFGYEAGKSNTDGDQGIFMGYKAGTMNTTGDFNTFIGSHAGYNNTEGYRNVFIGDSAGASNTIGIMNVFIGHQSGKSSSTGWVNTFVGDRTGLNNSSGYHNTFIGSNAGYSNKTGGYNIFIGSVAGNRNTAGERNVFIGAYSGYNSDSLSYNVFIGDRSGMANLRGLNNVFIGARAGIYNRGSNNVFLGYNAGSAETYGSSNTYVGYEAGLYSAGTGNVFLGYHAGYNEQGSNKLYIANTSTSIPLIYGIFDDKILTINGKLGVGTTTPTQVLDVNGNARFENIGSGAYVGAINRTSDGTLTVATSDIRAKDDINTLTNSLESVLNLRGVSFIWKDEPGMGKRIGFIAQEVEQVIPELVFTNPADGYKGVNYAEMTAVLVEAMKEQQKIIDSQQQQIDELKSLVCKLAEK
jgi:hypothetical protein